jgi:hypothetical protein
VVDTGSLMETSMSFRIVSGCVGGVLVGIAAIGLLSPHVRSLKPQPIDAAFCKQAWDRFAKAGDLVDLERYKFLLDQAHCDVRQLAVPLTPQS